VVVDVERDAAGAADADAQLGRSVVDAVQAALRAVPPAA